MICRNLHEAYLLEVGLMPIPTNHETISIVYHVKIHVDFPCMTISFGLLNPSRSSVKRTWMVPTILTNERALEWNAPIMGLQSRVWSGPQIWKLRVGVVGVHPPECPFRSCCVDKSKGSETFHAWRFSFGVVKPLPSSVNRTWTAAAVSTNERPWNAMHGSWASSPECEVGL